MPEDQDRWTFLTNHAHVLLCLARDPGIRLSDVAAEVGLTERGVQRIVKELTTSGYITRERNGRRNRYLVDHRQPLRRSIARHRQVGDLLRLVTGEVPPFDSEVAEGRDPTRIVSGAGSRGWGEVVANQEPSAGSTSGARGEGTVGHTRYGAA
ncbi:helix-turn-helix transcriptional regulator [Nannocystis pusilla]|uniref:helix-turn-helix transcriptional regulator n=1 Tax=Nannocystis pusilla TaxID=889268 RepID=UPI003BEF7992